MAMDPKAKSVSMSFREEYVEQLKTKEWFQKREEVLKHYGYKCALTGATGNLQIHHFEKSYKYGKKAWEYAVEDLIPLCEEEHRKMHDLYRKCPGFKVPEGEVCELIWHSSYTLCRACYFRKLDYEKARDRVFEFVEVCKEDGVITENEKEKILKMAEDIDQETVDEVEIIIDNFNNRGSNSRSVEKTSSNKKWITVIAVLLVLSVGLILSSGRAGSPFVVGFKVENAAQFIGKEVKASAFVHEVVEKKGNIHINLGGRFPDHDMALTIFYVDKKLFHWIPEVGQKIEFQGILSEHKDKPQIILTKQSQIKLK